MWEEDREEKDRKKTYLNIPYEFYFGINILIFYIIVIKIELNKQSQAIESKIKQINPK